VVYNVSAYFYIRGGGGIGQREGGRIQKRMEGDRRGWKGRKEEGRGKIKM